MKRGISTLGCPEKTLPEVVKLADIFHVDQIEIRSLSGSCDWAAELLKEENLACMEALSAAGRVSVLGCGFNLSCRENAESPERLVRVAERFGVPYLRVFGGIGFDEEIDDRIDDGLRVLDKEETDVIIDSRMAWHFVPASFAVYMAADPVVSAKRIMNAGRESEPFSSLEEAVRSVGERRKSEMLRYEKLYGVNIKDLENYDYVIDTSFVSPETVAEHIAAHFEMHRKGEKFPRYELSLSRLLPCLDGAGAPAFFERNGFYYIAAGEKEIVSLAKKGETLIPCVRQDAKEGAERACTPDKVRAWTEETGAAPAALPFAKKC